MTTNGIVQHEDDTGAWLFEDGTRINWESVYADITPVPGSIPMSNDHSIRDTLWYDDWLFLTGRDRR